MGPFLGDQSTASKTQIMTRRMGGAHMNQKESWVMRSGKRTPELGMTGGDSGVFAKVQLSAQANRRSMPGKAGGFAIKACLALLVFCLAL